MIQSDLSCGTVRFSWRLALYRLRSRADENSDCPQGKLFFEKEIEGIIFRAVMQMGRHPLPASRR